MTRDRRPHGGTGALLRRRHALLGTGAPLFYERPLHIVRGEGVWLYDAHGERYLDAYNNVPHVGHCHPKVVEAIARQAATLNTHTRYLHAGIVEYGERLVATFDAPLEMVVFACTGSEANDLALQLARFATGHAGFIVTDFSYHGNTTAVRAVSSASSALEPRSSAARTVPVPDPYRPPAGLAGADLADACVRRVQEAVDALHADGLGVAGILLDTIFSGEGLPQVPAGFVERAVGIVRAAGGLYIADEVQPGFGRMGDHFWGYRAHGVVPDVVTLGKPMGNGHPISAVIARRELLEPFGEARHYFNTFAGNPVSCAAANAVLDVLEEENLVARARETGEYLLEGLAALRERHRLVGDVRGRGLFIGVELVSDRGTREPATAQARNVINAMRERRVLIGETGRHENVLKLRPPLPFAREHADLLLAALDDCLGEAETPA